jgi:hypothetical protein
MFVKKKRPRRPGGRPGPAGSASDAWPREHVTLRAVAFRSVVHQVLVTGETEGSSARDVTDPGGCRLVATCASTSQVSIPGVGRGSRLRVAIEAGDVGLVVCCVAAGAVGLGGAQGQATGVAGGALDALVRGVVEGQLPTRPIEGPDGYVHGSRDPGLHAPDLAAVVASRAVPGQRLGVVTGPAVSQSSDEGAAVRPLIAVTRLTLHLLVLGVPEREIERGRPAWQRVSLVASRLGHPHAGSVTGEAVVAATGHLHIVGVVATRAAREHSWRQSSVEGRQELGPLVAARPCTGGPDLPEIALRDHVVAGGADGPMRLVGRHGLVETVLLALGEAA